MGFYPTAPTLANAHHMHPRSTGARPKMWSDRQEDVDRTLAAGKVPCQGRCRSHGDMAACLSLLDVLGRVSTKTIDRRLTSASVSRLTWLVPEANHRVQVWLTRQKGRHMLDASIIDPIEERLDNHPGRRSRVTVAALLTAIVRNAEQGRPNTRAEVTETLNSFAGEELVALGVLSADQTPEPFSYASVTKRMKQLEHALSEGWTVDGVEYDLDWFTRAMISASVLVGIEVVPHAEAADSTTFTASA